MYYTPHYQAFTAIVMFHWKSTSLSKGSGPSSFIIIMTLLIISSWYKLKKKQQHHSSLHHHCDIYTQTRTKTASYLAYLQQHLMNKPNCTLSSGLSPLSLQLEHHFPPQTHSFSPQKNTFAQRHKMNTKCLCKLTCPMSFCEELFHFGDSLS